MTDNSTAGTSPIQQNPALEPLAFLAGVWDMELSNASFLPNPSDRVQGSVTFAWAQGGAFLALTMGDQALWLIGRDASVPDYTVLYYDARSVSRVYAMSFSGQVWKMWRDAPGFSQRFEGIVGADGATITAHWEKSTDGASWEHDFDVTYTKASTKASTEVGQAQ